MGPDHVFFMLVGAVITLAVQWYGRRKVKQAMTAPDLVARRGVELLDNENERRSQQIDRLQERIAVMEQIATDPGTRTAREIEKLRMEA
jgi:hypothetical protein